MMASDVNDDRLKYIRLVLAEHKEALLSEERIFYHASWYDIEWLLDELGRLHQELEKAQHQQSIALSARDEYRAALSVETGKRQAAEAENRTLKAQLERIAAIGLRFADAADAANAAVEIARAALTLSPEETS